jgi:hypothetical protein
MVTADEMGMYRSLADVGLQIRFWQVRTY